MCECVNEKMCELKNLRESANRACEFNEVKSAGGNKFENVTIKITS